MRITAEHRYAHDTPTVLKTFTEASEIRLKQQALGARNIRIDECDVDADCANVRFTRELPATVPSLLQSFIQPWNRVQQSEVWQREADGFAAQLVIDIAGVPVDVAGSLNLKQVSGGCINEVCIDVLCGIPFIGKALAEFVAADCERLIAEEYDYITERLDA